MKFNYLWLPLEKTLLAPAWKKYFRRPCRGTFFCFNSSLKDQVYNSISSKLTFIEILFAWVDDGFNAFTVTYDNICIAQIFLLQPTPDGTCQQNVPAIIPQLNLLRNVITIYCIFSR